MARATALLRTDKTPVSSALGFLGFAAAMATLYFARAIIVPLALAVLFTFVLTPLVDWLQNHKFGRAPSVLIAAFLTLALITTGVWTVSSQLVDLASQLPQYKENIHNKLDALQSSQTGMIGKLAGSLRQMSEELSPAAAPAGAAATSKQKVTSVRLVEPARNLMQYAVDVLGPLLRPLEMAAIVAIFTVFMLFERVSLRNRLLRLVGQQQLSLATKALGDAAERVSRFLLMQVVVNAVFGLILGAGLAVIGVPHALLFGLVGGMLRFIPYIGTLVAIAMPLALSLAVFNTWRPLLLTLGLFLVLELTIANVIEPWLYGAHTGVSSLAILVAAVFWASLWGPVGLFLSTPLTVCLVVIGKHVSHLQFLDILLGDEPVLLPAERFYQRLLALDVDEARTILHGALRTSSLVAVYDQVVVAALSLAEQDRYRSDLRDTSMEFICASTNELAEELAGSAAQEIPPVRKGDRRVLCFGASHFADEVTAGMLAQVLEREGYVALPFSLDPPPIRVLEQFSSDARDIVCICALPPLAVMHARSLAKQIRAQFPDISIIVGLWSASGPDQERAEKLVGEKVVTTLAAATAEVAVLSGCAPAELTEPQMVNAV